MRAAFGVDRQAPDLAAAAAPAIRVSSVASGGTSKVWLMPWRPSTSTSRTRWPPDASAMAIAAATVVLPVPPLPVTTCSRTPDVVRADMRRDPTTPANRATASRTTRKAGSAGSMSSMWPTPGSRRPLGRCPAPVGRGADSRPRRDGVVGVAVDEHQPG